MCLGPLNGYLQVHLDRIIREFRIRRPIAPQPIMPNFMSYNLVLVHFYNSLQGYFKEIEISIQDVVYLHAS